jgi:hypothetical protein
MSLGILRVTVFPEGVLMSHFTSKSFAVLSVLSLMAVSPSGLKLNQGSRSIASVQREKEEVLFPKYQARSEKIDKEAIEKIPEADVEKFSQIAEEYRLKLMKTRDEFKVKTLEPEKVKEQKIVLNELVTGMMQIDDLRVILKDAWSEEGETIAKKSVLELKVTLESLLQDEVENDLLVQKDQHLKKEEEEKKESPTVVAVKEEASQPSSVCQLEEKNQLLSQQVESLLQQQNKIMETLLGVTQMMVSMHQNQAPNPWYSNSRLPEPYQYPAYDRQVSSGQWVFVPQGQAPLVNGPFQSVQPQTLGIYPDQIQLQPSASHQAPESWLMNTTYQEYDARYFRPAPHLPGSFGVEPFLFNFAQTPMV